MQAAAAARHFRRLHIALGKLVFLVQRRPGGNPFAAAALHRLQSRFQVAAVTLHEAHDVAERARLRRSMQSFPGLRTRVGG